MNYFIFILGCLFFLPIQLECASPTRPNSSYQARFTQLYNVAADDFARCMLKAFEAGAICPNSACSSCASSTKTLPLQSGDWQQSHPDIGAEYFQMFGGPLPELADLGLRNVELIKPLEIKFARSLQAFLDYLNDLCTIEDVFPVGNWIYSITLNNVFEREAKGYDACLTFAQFLINHQVLITHDGQNLRYYQSDLASLVQTIQVGSHDNLFALYQKAFVCKD